MRKVSFRHSFSVVLIVTLVAYMVFSGYVIQGIVSQRNSLSSELERYRLNNPTIDELKDFLMKDQTSKKISSVGYDCTYFARDLRNNARFSGINMCIVVLDVTASVRDEYGPFDFYGGQMMNGVTLSDGTFVWIEPQDDSIIYDRETLEHHVFEVFAKQAPSDVTIDRVTLTDEVQIW